MDHERAITPAVRSPISSPPVLTPASSTALRFTLPQSPPDASKEKQEEKKQEATQVDDADAEYDVDTEQEEVVDEARSNPVSWQREAITDAIDDKASVAEKDAYQSQFVVTDHVLPPAASLSLVATGDFSVQKHGQSVVLSSNDRITQSTYDQPNISQQLSFAVQPVPDTTQPTSATPSSPTIPAALLPLPSVVASGDIKTELPTFSSMTDRPVEADSSSDQKGQEQRAQVDDNAFDSLSLSAIAPPARAEEVDQDEGTRSDLSALDAKFMDTSISVPFSTTAVVPVTQQTRAVVVEDEDEQQEDLQRREAQQERQALTSSYSVAPSQLKAADPTTPPSVQTRTPVVALERQAQQLANYAQPETLATQATNATASNRLDTPARPVVDRPPASTKSAVPLTLQPRPHQTSAIRHQRKSPQPAHDAAIRGTVRNNLSAFQPSAFPFTSPSHMHTPQYVFQSAMARHPQFFAPVGPPPARRMPAAQPASPPLLPAPITPSAPYVASKQALQHMIARHQHNRANRQQQAKQLQQHATSDRSILSANRDSYHDMFDGNEVRRWQARQHSDERLARMLKVWQLSGQGGGRSVVGTRRELEEKEDVEMEWLARQEEQRRQEERIWHRSRAHRPATPAAPFRAATAWQEEDEGSEAGGEEVEDQQAATVVDLMEKLRSSARQEIEMQDAARQGLR